MQRYDLRLAFGLLMPSFNDFLRAAGYIHQGKMQLKQLFKSRGFQSSSEPLIHFGYGNLHQIDSLLVIWRDNTIEKKYDIAANQTLEWFASEDRQKVNYSAIFPQSKTWFEKAELPGSDYEHQENRYIDFNRQKLIPYKN